MARSKGNTAKKVEASAETPTAVAEQKFPTTAELIASGFNTKSARIRELARLGMKTGEIAKQETGGLYQHAYNVLKRPLKTVDKPELRPAAENEGTTAEQE